MEKKLQKPYFISYNLLKAQDLWQSHCQTLPIILLKELIKLNAFMYITKNCETFGIKHRFCECCLEYTNVKVDLIEYNCL